jgi:cytochrome P450
MEAFDLYSPAIDADPFPYYEILREQYPCYWSESAQLWILSRYDDIVRAAREWETFSSAQGNMIDELPGRAGATLGTTDPPRHDRLRALSQTAFARKNIELLVAPTIEIADRALARICEAKAFEFINDFSSQITVGLLFRTMGLPERDHADIRRKVILAVSTDKAMKGRNAAHIAAFKELSDFLTAEVAVRRANPTDDLITHLAEAEIDGDRLSEREIVLTTATFVMAGVESLSSFMSMFALNLHDHPNARRRVVANASSCAQPTSMVKACASATGSPSLLGPATATGGNSPIPTCTISIASRRAIWALGWESISASAARWRDSSPRSRCAASSRGCQIIISPPTRSSLGIRRRISAARSRCTS